LTTNRRNLVRIEEFADTWLAHHQIEGTKLHVAELMMIGFGYASHYILLRSQGVAERLKDAEVRAALSAQPYAYGKKLVFGPDLELEANGTLVYIRTVAPNNLLAVTS
jgi:hypothetical protein